MFLKGFWKHKLISVSAPRSERSCYTGLRPGETVPSFSLTFSLVCTRQTNALLMSLTDNLMWLFLFKKLLRTWSERTGCCRADARPSGVWYSTESCVWASYTVLGEDCALDRDLQCQWERLRREASPQPSVSPELLY